MDGPAEAKQSLVSEYNVNYLNTYKCQYSLFPIGITREKLFFNELYKNSEFERRTEHLQERRIMRFYMHPLKVPVKVKAPRIVICCNNELQSGLMALL